MEIPRDPTPVDPVARRRAAEAARRPAARTRSEAPAGLNSDAVSTPSSESVGRYVEMLKAHSADPAKLEALRRALEDGSFTATPEELVDPLLDQLDDGG